ncbi:MAG: hypothetical protein GY932_10380, partial [Arcobacter sp.]|nr:hypothetical protein [Arcobacter sp.]
LCSNNSKNSIDIANSSRRIKNKELQSCAQKGIKDIVELYVGRNGIALVQNNNTLPFSITREELFLALAKEIPNRNKVLIKNPYKRWNEINPKLPKIKIQVYGHKKTAGIRLSFDAIVIKHISVKSKNISPIYKQAGFKEYISLREDGVFKELNGDKNILEEVSKNKNAIGVLNYLHYSKNMQNVRGLEVEGVLPTKQNIKNASYKLAKKLYIYYRKSNKFKKPCISSYNNIFLSDETIGIDGLLKEIGFVPLSKEQREQARQINKQNKVLIL